MASLAFSGGKKRTRGGDRGAVILRVFSDCRVGLVPPYKNIRVYFGVDHPVGIVCVMRQSLEDTAVDAHIISALSIWLVANISCSEGNYILF